MRMRLPDLLSGFPVAPSRRSLLIATLTVAMGGALPADTPAGPLPPQSQQQQQEEQEAERGQAQEVITVTARKREEALTDVPFSIVAPTEEILRERGAETLEDVSANVAGFSVQNLGPGQSQVAMRGLSAGQVVRDQPGVKEQVGIYLDESVVSLSLFTPDLDLFDMSRVEVLRGPQGTLFGSGSLAGTVRYISNQPSLGVAEGIVELSLSAIDGGDVGGNARRRSTCRWRTPQRCASRRIGRRSPVSWTPCSRT